MKASQLQTAKLSNTMFLRTSCFLPIRAGASMCVCVCVLWGHSCHTYKMVSGLNRHRGVEAINPLAAQHNRLPSPRHQSLSQSTPPTHTHWDTHTHAQTNAHAHTYTDLNHTLCDRSLIMPLILSDTCMYNGGFPGAVCQSIHPFIHPSSLLSINLPT